MEIPALCSDGDVHLLLDDGGAFCAHSSYLSHASTVLRDALACSMPAAATPASPDELEAGRAVKQRRVHHKLPLPGTTKEQVLLLLHCIHAWEREAWVCALDASQLVELATVADKLGASAVFKLVDSTFVRLCEGLAPSSISGVVNSNNAYAVLLIACKLQLPQSTKRLGSFIGSHPDAISKASMNAALAAILDGAAGQIQCLSEKIKRAEREGYCEDYDDGYYGYD